MKIIRLWPVLILPAVAGLANAQVQKCMDDNGKILYTQTACPHSASSRKALKTPTPGNGETPTSERNWTAENEALNKRQAQREHDQMVQNNNRAAIDAFNKAVAAPLAPGERRRVTLTLPAQ